MASTLSANVYSELLHDLLAGDPAPGDALPSERVLSERFGVNRHAVREAVKRLQQAGLVRVSQGGATRVLDWREHGGLALMEHLVEADPESPELLRAALEMRRCIGADAARGCADRGDADVVAALAGAIDSHGPHSDLSEDDPSDDDPPDDVGDQVHADAYELLWRTIVVGCGNVAYRLALNSLVAGDSGVRMRELSLAEAWDVDAQRELVAAIAAGDGDLAGEIAEGMLTRTILAARSMGLLDPSGRPRTAAASPEGAPDG